MRHTQPRCPDAEIGCVQQHILMGTHHCTVPDCSKPHDSNGAGTNSHSRTAPSQAASRQGQPNFGSHSHANYDGSHFQAAEGDHRPGDAGASRSEFNNGCWSPERHHRGACQLTSCLQRPPLLTPLHTNRIRCPLAACGHACTRCVQHACHMRPLKVWSDLSLYNALLRASSLSQQQGVWAIQGRRIGNQPYQQADAQRLKACKGRKPAVFSCASLKFSCQQNHSLNRSMQLGL